MSVYFFMLLPRPLTLVDSKGLVSSAILSHACPHPYVRRHCLRHGFPYLGFCIYYFLQQLEFLMVDRGCERKSSLSGWRGVPSYKRARVHNNSKSEHLLLKQKVWENSDGCAEHYRCATALYLMSILSQVVFVIIDRGISAPGHGRELVEVLNAIEKRFLFQLMSTLQLLSQKNMTHIWLFTL